MSHETAAHEEARALPWVGRAVERVLAGLRRSRREFSSDGEAMSPGVEVVRARSPPLRARSAGVGARGRYVAGVVALAVAYYGAAKLGYALEFAGPVAAIVWLPAGVAIAFLSLGGLRFWPGVLVGDLLANDYAALPLGSALGQTLGNMLEVLVAALVIRRLLARGSPLDSLGGLGRLLAVIAGATAISATIGPLSLLAGDVITGGDCWRSRAPGGSATPPAPWS